MVVLVVLMNWTLGVQEIERILPGALAGGLAIATWIAWKPARRRDKPVA